MSDLSILVESSISELKKIKNLYQTQYNYTKTTQTSLQNELEKCSIRMQLLQSKLNKTNENSISIKKHPTPGTLQKSKTQKPKHSKAFHDYLVSCTEDRDELLRQSDREDIIVQAIIQDLTDLKVKTKLK
jgi:hypothetical protein